MGALGGLDGAARRKRSREGRRAVSEEEEIGAGAFAEEDEREPIDLAVVEFLIRGEMAVIERINPTWVEAIHAQRAILQSLESFANEQIAAIKKDPGEKPESTVNVRNIGLAGAEMLPPRFPATERAEAERAEDEEDG